LGVSLSFRATSTKTERNKDEAMSTRASKKIESNYELLHALLYERDLKTKEIAKAVELAFPLDARVVWESRGYLQHGIVVDVSAERVKVFNPRTKKEYWLYVRGHELSPEKP
jgi:hypothetical protein